MRRIFTTLIVLLCLVFPFTSFAQTNEPVVEEKPSFEFFTVRVYTEGQSAWNKRVPIFVEFKATINSDKVQIDWDAPSGVKIIPKYPKFFSVVAGQTYTFKALVEPTIAGTFNIASNVIAWQYNTNYTSSGNTVIKFSEDLLTDPISSEYTLGVAIKWVTLILGIGISGYLGYIYFIKSKKKFDKWFNLPD